MSSSLRRRRGSVYIIVLVTAMIVVAIGVTGLQLQRIDARNASLEVDTGEARLLAQSAVAMGAELMSQSTTWRSAAAGASGVISSGTLGRAEYGLVVSDPSDGDLVDNDDDPVTLSSVVVINDSVQVASAVVAPVFTPYDVLSNALTTGSDINVSGGTLRADAEVFAIGSVTASSATVAAHVRATGSIGGATYQRSISAGQTAPTFPTGFMSAWAAKGTNIPSAGLGGGKIEKILLSPSSNPLGGGTNARGIYVIDCGNRSLTIENCRLHATVLFLNTSTLTIGPGVVIDAPELGAPALLVAGSLAFSSNNTSLTESSLGFNLNPAGAPWKGASDSDTSDTYTCGIWGLVYVHGSLAVPSGMVASFTGSVIAHGAATISGSLTVTHDPAIVANPPDGFRTGPTWQIQPGTWSQGTR